RGHQAFGFAQYVRGRPRNEVAPQLRDDAEATAIVAALGNLQVGVMPRRELDAFRRQQIEERIVLRRHRAMDGIDYALVLLRAGDSKNARIMGDDLLGLRTHAAGDDHLAVRLNRLADSGQRLGLGTLQKAAGVDDRHVGALVRPGELIAFRPQARDDALAVDQRLRAAKRDEAYLRRARDIGISLLHM